ncbi:hypothetical protein AB0K50_29350 [Amycolatopsis methanolica]
MFSWRSCVFRRTTRVWSPGRSPRTAASTRRRELGRFTYPVGAIPFTQADWRHHFGSRWPSLCAWKSRYDPAGVLTPGPGIFSRPASFSASRARPPRIMRP